MPNQILVEPALKIREQIGVCAPEPLYSSAHLHLGDWRFSVSRRTATPAEVTRMYDRESSFWAGLIGAAGYGRAYRSLFGHLCGRELANLRDQTGGRPDVLDCGTGTGALLEAFAREFAECGGKGANLRGMDRSPRMLYKAAERFKAAGLEGAFQRGECERLPYDSGSFDFVMTAHMLEHVEDVHAAIREMSRVLRPGGLLLAIVTRPGVIDALFRLLWRYQTVREDTLRSAFWEAGLARISRAPVGRVISPARWLSSAYLAVKTGEGRPFRARPLHSETIPSGAAR